MVATESGAPTTFRCRALLVDSRSPRGSGTLVVAQGRVAAFAHGGTARRLAAAARGPVVEVDGALAPGFVDAHAHLDLSALVGRVPPEGGFVPWIGALLRERSAVPREALVEAARAAVARLLAGGTTTVGDVDTLGIAEEALAGSPQRVVLFREVLDGARPERGPAALDALDRALRSPVRGAGPRLRGLSPHAPHTVSRATLRALGARRAGRPVQVHWAETPEELEWLAAGTGPFAPVLGPAPRRDGLALLAAAGLLDGASLVHANHPGPGDPERLAAAGATVVHCPGTHAFFARPPFPWDAFRRAGVPLALGTDSLASNDVLDLGRELARARGALPGVDPRDLFDAATRGGATALGFGGDLGTLVVGAPADFVAHASVEPVAGRHADDGVAWIDRITAGETAVRGVWIAGALAAGRASD